MFKKPNESFWAITKIKKKKGTALQTGNATFVRPPNNSPDLTALQLMHNGFINQTSQCYDFFIEGFIPTSTLDENLQQFNGIEKIPNHWDQSTFTRAYLTVEKKGAYSKIVGIVETHEKSKSKFIGSTVFAGVSGRAIGITKATRENIRQYIQQISTPPFYILEWNLPNVRADSSTTTSFGFI